MATQQALLPHRPTFLIAVDRPSSFVWQEGENIIHLFHHSSGAGTCTSVGTACGRTSVCNDATAIRGRRSDGGSRPATRRTTRPLAGTLDRSAAASGRYGFVSIHKQL